MLFRRKKSDTMTIEQLRKLDKTPVKYVTRRDGETAREIRLGEGGAINVIGGDFAVICGGKDVFRAPLEKVKAGELMNLSGLTLSFTDEKGERISVIAYYSDGHIPRR